VKPYVCSILLFALFVIAASPPASAATLASPATASVTSTTGLYTDKQGRVGVDTARPLVTLDASRGEIKIGSTGLACTPQLAGTLRFDHDQLWLCNAHGWQPLAMSAH
jgi:hypothetical protein